MNKPLRPDGSSEQPQPTDLDDDTSPTTSQTGAEPRAPSTDDEAQATTTPRIKNT